MELRFFKDPETELPHIYDHGVTEQEVHELLASPGEVRKGDRDSLIALGQTLAGRYLRVIYVPDRDTDSAFVVTAYPLRGKQLKAYRRAQRKRGK